MRIYAFARHVFTTIELWWQKLAGGRGAKQTLAGDGRKWEFGAVDQVFLALCFPQR